MSQINTNTIANELGTGGPDFVGMPSVAGDPVVQSGSNTDGEWTRWADGTAICTNSITVGAINNAAGGLYRSNSVVWNYPIAFTNVPRPSGHQKLGTDAWVSLGAIGSDLSRTSFRFFRVTIEAASVGVLATATGRWK